MFVVVSVETCGVSLAWGQGYLVVVVIFMVLGGAKRQGGGLKSSYIMIIKFIVNFQECLLVICRL